MIKRFCDNCGAPLLPIDLGYSIKIMQQCERGVSYVYRYDEICPECVNAAADDLLLRRRTSSYPIPDRGEDS